MNVGSFILGGDRHFATSRALRRVSRPSTWWRLVRRCARCRNGFSAARMPSCRKRKLGTRALANTLMCRLFGSRIFDCYQIVGLTKSRECGFEHAKYCIDADKTPFIFAHEFFDALPINAFQSIPPATTQQEVITPTGPTKMHKTSPQWRELMVMVNPKIVDGEQTAAGEPEFTLTLAKASTPTSLVIPEVSQRYKALKSQPGATIEISPEGRIYAAEFARRIGGDGGRSGAALIMDYGPLATIPINSLRGIREHRTVPPLSSPGQVDVSADVDFTALAEAAIGASEDVEVHGPVEQGDFLQSMGIAERMQQLLRKVPDPEKRKNLESAWQRLVEKGGGGMGRLYKVMAIIPENGGKRRPVGFGGGLE